MFDRLRQGLLACALFLFVAAGTASVRAADAEARAFESAQKYLGDGFHELAEKAFADFTAKHPASPRVAQARLLEAQALLAQKKFTAAVSLLTTNLPNAGSLADQFQLGIAQAQARSGNLEAAAGSFADLVARYTNSSLRLEATLGEAEARFERQQWPRVISLLQNTGGVFQASVVATPDTEAGARGQLLLAEALLKQREFAAAEQLAGSIPDRALNASGKWRREYLRAKAQFAAHKLPAALATTSNLVSIASTTRQPALEAAGVALQGEILEALHQPEAARAAYEQNQRPGRPPERIREAVFKTVELTLALGQITNAQARLQTYLAEHPNETGSDLALLTLAELRLKQFQLALASTNAVATNAPMTTNLLAELIADCDKLLRDFTNSPFAGRAYLTRGWALLFQDRTTDSLAAFRAAAESLPWSEAQAVARFKVADLEFRTGEVTNALRNYGRVLAEYQALPEVQSQLVPRARYQMLQTGIATRNVAAATASMDTILREYPVNSFTERTLLLFGQAVNELGDPATARGVFSNFVARFPHSPLRPEVELAGARTYERQRDWPGAITAYDAWVRDYSTNENLAAAEYALGQAHWHAGQDTNTFTLYTNFVVRFATNALLAPSAQNWVGDFYFGLEQFDAAERNYQLIYQNTNWPLTDLSYQAKLKAGRSALMRLSFDDATNYFISIIEDPHAPKALVVLASFAYGDAWLQRPWTNALEKFSTALSIYGQIDKFHADDPQVPRAWGQMANCHFQLGGADPLNYAPALALYEKVTNAPSADRATRSQAEIGIGNVHWKQAKLAQKAGLTAEASSLLETALKSFLRVVYADLAEGPPDPLWVKEAALNAADIAEAQNKWDSAFHLYRRLGEMLPQLRPGLEKKMANAQEQAALQKP